jgi:2,4-dienoyl-CoA reductase-like NADH-dependent reductase (Old Yellow Enzyme family)
MGISVIPAREHPSDADDVLWQPITVGTLQLDHRLVVSTHGGGNGNLMGSEEEFEQHCALWLAKVRGGVRWVGGGPNFVRNPLPPGFEPTGVGAHGPGFFRDPMYPARIGEFADRVHGEGGYLSVQMVLQGGMPIGPSPTFSGHASHVIAHALDVDEVQWLIREYVESAVIALDAGVDAIEIHANHDDVIEWFLSPATNHRRDAYGGGLEGRRRLLREIVSGIRAASSRPFTFGLRLCLDQMIDGGLGLDECQAIVAAFTAEGEVDYFSLDVGNNWDAPSYIPIAWHDDHEWSPLAGQVKAVTNLPVIYGGRVAEPGHAADILRDGHADLVAVARATMADPEFVAKARAGTAERIRPCIGLNDCIHRKLVDGLPYACGVNPMFARERVGRPGATAAPRRLLVIGGGPAGMEVAGLCAEQGHAVELWERSEHLGGALATAAKLRGNRRYGRWIDWQAGRLERAGVVVRLGHVANADAVVGHGADVVLLAVGADPRTPDIVGIDQEHVILAVDAVNGLGELGHRVALIVEDDGPAPPTIADHLAGLGHAVTMIFQTAGPAPGVGKYSLGSMLARLDEGGVDLVGSTKLIAIVGQDLDVANSFSGIRRRIGPFDSVVLACGSTPRTSLHDELRGRHPDVRILGDAYAPRRTVFATRQAWATMLELN